MRSKIIRVHWADPRPIDDVISSLPDDAIGLYYITRICRGKESSLYIGESISSIKSRLLSHKNWVHGYSRSEIFVRIGKVVYPKHNVDNAILHAEKALIFEHGQHGAGILIENTVSTSSYSYTDIFKIINEGNRFELLPEVDMQNHEEA